MRKNIIALSSLVLALLLALSTMAPVNANINTAMWLEPTFEGVDTFYDTFVIAYAEGATAKLAVTVDRDGAPVITQVNITAVSVVFDWGGNYTLALTSPYILNDTITQAAFTVTFTVPSSTIASNLFLHTYRVIVKYVTTSGANQFVTISDMFAVYSTTQSDAQTQGQTANGYSGPVGGFESPEANILWEKGNAALSKGNIAYTQGNFAAAKTYYENAITLYEQAYTTETSQDTRAAQTAQMLADANYRDALANATTTQANAATKQADASMIEANAATTQAEAALRQADAALTNAYGWMAFGFGWILIGIGAVIYGLRRPTKPPG